MTVTNDEQAAPDREECLEKFMDTCLQKGLLARFESLELRDSCDGLLDQPTLLYVTSTYNILALILCLSHTRRFLTARKFDHDEAVKHFEAARKFREEKHLIRLYDLVQISDFENTRSMVSVSLFSGVWLI